MAAAPVFVSIEEYLQRSYSPDAEYIDGQIVERESTITPHGRRRSWSGLSCRPFALVFVCVQNCVYRWTPTAI